MKTLTAVLLATLLGFGATAAHSQESAAKAKSAKAPAPVVATPAPPAAVPVQVSQQDKMRLCSKQATGQKGAERKDFMKTCLSKKTA